MNKNISKLAAIGAKNKRTIIGLMSGTSLDGLDVALCEIEGFGANTKLKLKNFITENYTEDFKAEIRQIFSTKKVDLEKLCLLNEWIAEQHAKIVKQCLKKWKVSANKIDLIASHGQTIYHAPKHLHQNKKFGNGTLQIGDGDHLAVKTGIITISDFRQKHIAAGGEGAPLAAYGDLLLFKKKDTDVILLNIGGIANLTYLPAKGKVFSTDIGPGNTLMDAWVQKNYPKYSYDKDAAIARSGTVQHELLAALQDNLFFTLPFPKTTGPELFNLDYLAESLKNIVAVNAKDVMATLNKFAADNICIAIKKIVNPGNKTKIYVSGGGIHNPLLMEHLQQELKGMAIASSQEANVHPDAKEAILFAVLANECVAGDGKVFGKGSKDFPAVALGKISLPG